MHYMYIVPHKGTFKYHMTLQGVWLSVWLKTSYGGRGWQTVRIPSYGWGGV